LPSARPPGPGPVELPGVKRILLVGIMGSGKTTIGRRLARILRWPFRDFDEEIEALAGRSVPVIFSELGEAEFRRLEDEVARHLLSVERVVLGSGGGWPCRPGRMESLDAETLSVWMRISPEEAVRRATVGARVRPLLQVDDPLARMEALLEERTPHYRRARWVEESDGHAPDEVAHRLARRLLEDLG
jgi:shikimate kinase